MDVASAFAVIVRVGFSRGRCRANLWTPGQRQGMLLRENRQERHVYPRIPGRNRRTVRRWCYSGVSIKGDHLGQYDVDVTLESPSKEIIYRQVKTQFDSHTFTPTETGVYKACFSNEFSTFSHKLVYMDFQVGDELPLPGLRTCHSHDTDGILSSGDSQKPEQHSRLSNTSPSSWSSRSQESRRFEWTCSVVVNSRNHCHNSHQRGPGVDPQEFFYGQKASVLG